jgi:hypothetical protein
MAFTRSAVRSRLAPPAFARFASYGSASRHQNYRSDASEGCRAVARRAKAGRFDFLPDRSPDVSRQSRSDGRAHRVPLCGPLVGSRSPVQQRLGKRRADKLQSERKLVV